QESGGRGEQCRVEHAKDPQGRQFMIRARQPRAQCGDQDTERRGKGVQPIPRIINKAVPLQEIPAAAEGNEVILPGVVRKQGERDRDGERHSRDQPIEVSPLHTAKGGSMSGAGLRLVDVTKNRSPWPRHSRAPVEGSRCATLKLPWRDSSTSPGMTVLEICPNRFHYILRRCLRRCRRRRPISN